MVTEAELKQLRKLFAEIDEDGSGLLDRGEVYQLAEKLGATLSTAELDAAMAEMDEDGSGEVDFDEFALWFGNAKEQGGSKWVDALNDKLGDYQKETEAFLATLNDGNTDAALGNLNQLLCELPGEEGAELRQAMDHVFTPIFDVRQGTGEKRPYKEMTDVQWHDVVRRARGRAIGRMADVPTKFLLVHGIPEDVKASRVEGLIKNLKARPKFFDWVRTRSGSSCHCSTGCRPASCSHACLITAPAAACRATMWNCAQRMCTSSSSARLSQSRGWRL